MGNQNLKLITKVGEKTFTVDKNSYFAKVDKALVADSTSTNSGSIEIKNNLNSKLADIFKTGKTIDIYYTIINKNNTQINLVKEAYLE